MVAFLLSTVKGIPSLCAMSKKASPVNSIIRSPAFAQSAFHRIVELALSNTLLLSDNTTSMVSPYPVWYCSQPRSRFQNQIDVIIITTKDAAIDHPTTFNLYRLRSRLVGEGSVNRCSVVISFYLFTRRPSIQSLIFSVSESWSSSSCSFSAMVLSWYVGYIICCRLTPLLIPVI